MKLFKKALISALIILGLSLSAQQLKVAVIMPSATTDLAFSESMWDALKKVQTDLGGEGSLLLKYSDNMFVVADAAAAIRDYASQKFDIVIAHGSQYGSSVKEIAADFPKTIFAWGTDVNTFGLNNIYAYTAAAEEGGYINGVLAAKLSKTKKIGVTGAIEVGDSKTYIDGFIQGVASVDKNITVSKTWTGSFSDVALMTAAAKTQIANGADILTGSSQAVIGSIGVAKDKGTVLWFGTQFDQAVLAPKNVVASQVYDWTAFISMIVANKKLGILGGKSYTLNLENKGLKIKYNTSYPLPASAKKAAEDAISAIVSKKLKVNP